MSNYQSERADTYIQMWNRGPRNVNRIKYAKGEHRHDDLPEMCGSIDGKFTHVFTAENAFNVNEPTAQQYKWIDVKRKYPDAVVLVKIGKFYELFHRDADIFVDISDGCYMSYDKIAHTGFPENALEKFTNKLNEAGYNVIKTI